MNKTKITNVQKLVSFALLIFSISLSIIYYHKSKTFDTIIEDCSKLAILATAADERLIELNSMGYILDDIYLSDNKGDKIHLSEVLNNSSKIVFVYSPLQCNSCYESQLELLSDSYENTQKLVILTYNDVSLKKISMINKTFSVDVPIYKLTGDRLPFPVDTIGKPYFFKINVDLRSSDVFIPNKNAPQLTTAYINRVLNI